MKQARVLILAGGTGGHIFPALAVAGVLREHRAAPFWLGTSQGMEARIVPAHDIPLVRIAIGGLRGKGWRRQLFAPFAILRATLAAIAVILRIRPGVVLGMGGFVSGPGGVAAWICRLPLVIHEQNAVPGLTNRLLSRLASRVLCAYPTAFPAGPRVVVTGNPVRREIARASDPAARATREGPRRVLVLGGSLGAATLNRVAPISLGEIAGGLPLEVLHQTGERDRAAVQAAYTALGVAARVTPFIEDMAEAYAWADCVVCRAGALTLAELCAAGLPAILVPYPHAVDDHQTANARYLCDREAALMLRDAELVPHTLAAKLRELLAEPPKMRAMGLRAHALAAPQATEAVARHCLELMPDAA